MPGHCKYVIVVVCPNGHPELSSGHVVNPVRQVTPTFGISNLYTNSIKIYTLVKRGYNGYFHISSKNCMYY
jgi:hypothetical protein